jgi:hypothetical protein
LRPRYHYVLVLLLLSYTFAFVPTSANATALFAFTSQESFSASTTLPTNHSLIEFHGASAYKLVQQTLSALLPAETDIDALDFINSNTIVFSLREDAVLPGVGKVADEDLLLWNGSTISLLWDGSANGLPPETDIDVVDVTNFGWLTFCFSLREGTTLPAPIGKVSRNDAIEWQNGSGFTRIFFYGTDIPPETNLDAFSSLSSNNVVISLNAAANIKGTSYGKADLIQYDIMGGSYNSFFNAAANGIPPEVNIQDCEATATAIPVELSRFEVD